MPTSFRSFSTSLLHAPRLATLLALAALSSGCGDGDERGSVSVEYRFGAGLTCESQGVDRVRVTIGTDFEEESACDTSESIVVSGVPAGTHPIVVAGLDSEGDMIRDNLGNNNPKTVEVLGDTTRAVEVVLTPTPVTVQVLFDVQEDGFAVFCPKAQPHFFVVEAYRGDGNQLLAHEWSYCTGYQGGFETLPDPDRDLDGLTMSNIFIQPLDSARNELGEPIEFQFDPPGAGKHLRLVVTCEGAVCTGGPVEVGSGDDGAPSDEGGSGGADETTG